MSKNVIILLVIIGLAILAGVYLVMTTKLITVRPETVNTPRAAQPKIVSEVETIDQKEMEASYRKNTKEILAELEDGLKEIELTATSSLAEAAVTSNNATSSQDDISGQTDIISKISELKISLMDLKTPDHLRDLHLSLVMALTKIKNYLDNDVETDRQEAFEIIEQAKLDYAWLND